MTTLFFLILEYDPLLKFLYWVFICVNKLYIILYVFIAEKFHCLLYSVKKINYNYKTRSVLYD